MFVVASPVDADAPLASARDTPAIPNAGKTFLRRLLFGERFAMAQFSRPFGHIGPIDRMSTVMLCPAQTAGQISKKLRI
jgi:hypothetical protein